MRDSPRTTTAALRIIESHTQPSRNGAPFSTGNHSESIAAWRWPLLGVLVLAILALAGCELLPELGVEDLAALPEVTEAGSAAVASGMLPIEEASEWPWTTHEAVLVDASARSITDARTGEFLGRMRLATDASFVDVFKDGDRSGVRFPIRGALDSSSRGQLFDRFDRQVATISRTDDGRFLVRALSEEHDATNEELSPLPVAGANRKEQPPQDGWHRFGDQDAQLSHKPNGPYLQQNHETVRSASTRISGSDGSRWHQFSSATTPTGWRSFSGGPARSTSPPKSGPGWHHFTRASSPDTVPK